jgi:lysyl endopeptidase
VNLAQQGSALFATWFTYDTQGQGQWLVMSDVTMTGMNTYGGAIYRTSGPAFDAGVFDPAHVIRTPVGSATFTFGDANHGTFTATVDGITVAKAITRLVFDSRVPVCAEGGDPLMSGNYQDLWWRAAGTESGWGLNLAHQGDTMFMTWFTYGADGKGMWLVASNIAKDAAGHYSGTVYRTTGPAFNATNWDASRVVRTPVGTVSFAFNDGGNGTFNYTVDGVTGSKPIARLQFAAPATVCQAT